MASAVFADADMLAVETLPLPVEIWGPHHFFAVMVFTKERRCEVIDFDQFSAQAVNGMIVFASAMVGRMKVGLVEFGSVSRWMCGTPTAVLRTLALVLVTPSWVLSHATSSATV